MKKMLKKLGRFIVIMAIAALLAAFLPFGSVEVKAEAENDVKYVPADYEIDENGIPSELVTKKKTVKMEEGTVKINMTYPKFKVTEGVDGNDKIISKLNKAMYNTFYKEAVEDADVYYYTYMGLLGCAVDLELEGSVNKIVRMGNIISVTADLTTGLPAYGIYVPTTLSQAFNLSTGKRVSGFGDIFENVDDVKQAIIDEVRTQIETGERIELQDIPFNENIDWDSIKTKLVLENMALDSRCSMVYLLAGDAAPLEVGVIPFVIDNDILFKYVKKDMEQVLKVQSPDAGLMADWTEVVSYNLDEEGNRAEVFTEKKTISYPSGSITVNTQYPKLIPFVYDTYDAVDAIQKACKKVFYTELVSEAKKYYESKGYSEGDNAGLEMNCEYVEMTRNGNLFVVSGYVTIINEDGIIEKEYCKNADIDLHTGKRITSLKSIFNDVDKMKSEIIKYAKKQLKFANDEESELIKKDIDWKAVKKSINLDTLRFAPSGANFFTPIGSIIDSDELVWWFDVPMDILLKYIKPEKRSLLVPESSAIISLKAEYNSECQWFYDEPEQEYNIQYISCFIIDKPDGNGGAYTSQEFFFRAVAPGEKTLKFQLYGPSDEILDEKSFDVVVDKNLVLTVKENVT